MAKVAIITGASSGIGRHSAVALSKAGWSVAIVARRLENLVETKDLCADPSKCLILQGDVASEESVIKVFADTIAHFGRLDLLFNNAGINAPSVPIEELPLAKLQEVFNVNVIGAFLCTREAVKVFKSQTPQGGRIINNGSLSAYTPRPNSAPYGASKHAVLGLTKSTLLDGRKFNITCTEIDIGNARTEMSSNHAHGTLQADGQLVPELMYDAKYVGDAIVYLAGLPHDVTVLTFNLMATGMPFVGRG